MIDKVTFRTNSAEPMEELTGDELYLLNEMARKVNGERITEYHIGRTNRSLCQFKYDDSLNADKPAHPKLHLPEQGAGKFDRILAIQDKDGQVEIYEPKQFIVPLGLFFSKYGPKEVLP